jgi:signal transduction histidine kinase
VTRPDEPADDLTPVAARWLLGGGEMGELVRARDWSQTPLGPIEGWPQSLRTAVSLCLASNFPISLAWGPQRVQIYNDGYWPICGAKHPASMGQDFKECWFSAWPAIGEAFESASAGRTAFLVNQRMFLDRNGYLEETFFTFSFSPIQDETGGVGGLFHPVTELTQQSLAERRLKVLRDLADRTSEAKSLTQAATLVADTLGAHDLDLPFVLLYLAAADGRTARLAGSAGLAAGTEASPAVVDLTDEGAGPWPLATVAGSGRVVEWRCPPALGACGPYPEPPTSAAVMPIFVPGMDHPLGLLVAGVSARRELDEPYRTFYVMLRESVGNALVNARAYEEERKRAEALAEIDRAKTAFFSNVSHEFRTPLTLMLGPVEDLLARAPAALAADDRERLAVVHRNGLRLQKLVNTLLDFSRIEAGRVQAVYEPTDLGPFTAELVSNFRSACERAGLRLVIDCPPLGEPVWVDRDMWEKIVLNLVSNAFKFTLEGEIAVDLRPVAGAVELTVRDTGIGIPADELPHVFERFHRVSGARGRTHEGTGIGLALVQELARLHGGTVRATSAPEVGSSFVVFVPRGQAHLPADRIGGARTLASTALGASPYVEEALRWLPDPAAWPLEPEPAAGPGAALMDSPVAPSGPAGGPEEARARVVWADDNADMREYVRRLLSVHFEVEAVADGRAALAAVRARRPDLVLADVMMPQLDGFEVLRALRGEAETRTLPVILLSARAGEEARVEGLRAGADDYLTKPFSARELVARVTAQVQMARVRRAAEQAIRESEQAVRAERRFLQSLLGNAPIGIAVVQGTALRYTLVNPAYQAIVGPDVPVLGRTVREVFPDAAERGAETGLREVLRTGQPWRVRDFETTIPGRAGLTWWDGEVLAVPDSPDSLLVLAWEVTERKRTELALRAADRAKDEFLAMLGHELRNPLGAIGSAIRVLHGAAQGDAVAARAHAVIDRQAAHLTRLVDDLLDIGRVTAGKVTLTRRPLDLAGVTTGVVQGWRAAGRLARHRVTLEAAPVWVEADETRLEQIVANLLGNALKFTPADGAVTVRVSRQDGQAMLQVEDAGAGMPAELVGRVFDLFVQGVQTPDRAHGGLGIGLTLVRHLVERHGGTVTAASAGAGCGSTFTVRLPAIAAPPPAAPPPASRPSTPRRVLLVEDNDDAREMLRFVLEADGHAVLAAADGPQALALAATAAPDLALVDIGLPGLDGYEVARRLRASTSRPLVLVALTGYGAPEDQARAIQAGFDLHLVKPVEPDALAALLSHLPTV